MAPRLAASVEVVQLGSPVGWPVWLLCTSVTLGVMSAVALLAYSRMQALDNERRKREEQQQQDEQFEILWSFPEKEDKAARFRRWAEVLRFKPREARPPIALENPRLDVKVALEVFFREAQAAGIASPRSAPAAGEHQAVTIEAGAAAAVLRERVKERILQFLIECGPPKGLCAITEEDKSIPSTPRSHGATPRSQHQHQHQHHQQQQHHLVDVRSIMEAASGAASPTPSTPSKASPRPPAALALDGEPVLRTETGETVTRELLWAVLARIHAEATEAAGSNTLPTTNTPTSTSAAATGCGQEVPNNLRQPLLGEWQNPLQAGQTAC